MAAEQRRAGRCTVAAPIERRGVGLHSGAPCCARVAPAPPGVGLRVNGAPVAEARLVPGPRATRLATPAGPVAVVEHLLAALYAREIDDAEITVEGGEVPILDGSAAEWARALQPAQHGGVRGRWTLLEAVEVRHGEAWARAEPAARLSIEVGVDYPLLGRQRFRTDLSDFLEGVAPARTFGFLRDAEPLRAAGLALGASLDNALVFDDAGHPLGALRFANEPARHKCLDLVGDLALLGAPLAARVSTERGGHALHHRLVAAIREVGKLDLTGAACNNRLGSEHPRRDAR